MAAFILGVALLAGCGSTHHEQVVLQGIDARSKHDLAFAAGIIRRRLDLLGMRKVTMEQKPGGRLVITTGRRLPLGERLLLVKTGSLAFYDLEADLSGRSKTATGQPIAATSLTHLLRRASFGMGHARQLFLVHNGQLVAGPETTRKALVAIAKLHGDSPKKPEVLAAPANTTLVTCEASPTNGCWLASPRMVAYTVGTAGKTVAFSFRMRLSVFAGKANDRSSSRVAPFISLRGCTGIGPIWRQSSSGSGDEPSIPSRSRLRGSRGPAYHRGT